MLVVIPENVYSFTIPSNTQAYKPLVYRRQALVASHVFYPQHRMVARAVRLFATHFLLCESYLISTE